MASNPLPSGIHDLMGLAERIHAELASRGPWMRFKITAEQFGAILEALRDAETALTVTRLRHAQNGMRQLEADAALTDWLARARLALMLALGAQWSERWIEAGFVHRATRVPKLMNPRVAFARGVVEFFERHPEYEIGFAGVRASAGRALYEKMIAARSAAMQSRIETSEIKRRRDAAEKALRSMMRNTIILLGVYLPSDDARWAAFGLNAPKCGRKHRSTAPARLQLPEQTVITMPLAAPEVREHSASSAVA